MNSLKSLLSPFAYALEDTEAGYLVARLEATRVSCDRRYISAAIKAVLTSLCVNVCLLRTVNVINGSYCSYRRLFLLRCYPG